MYLIVLMLSLMSAGGVGATHEPLLSWSALRGEEGAAPIKKVSPAQQVELQIVVNYHLTQSAFLEDVPERVKLAKQSLKQEGIDITPYLAQAITLKSGYFPKINEEVIGKVHLVGGFIVPLSMEGLLVTEFFLVPTAGACIHTPPPPENQIIYVTYSQGIVVESIYKPFIVEGELNAQPRRLETNFSDGVVNVQSAYTIKAISVKNY